MLLTQLKELQRYLRTGQPILQSHIWKINQKNLESGPRHDAYHNRGRYPALLKAMELFTRGQCPEVGPNDDDDDFTS